MGNKVTHLGVLDRTGRVMAAARGAATGAGVTVLDLGRPGELGPDTPYVDILVLGPQETSAAGLRRLAGWRDSHPPTFVVACLGEETAERPVLDAGVDVLAGPEGEGLPDALAFWAARHDGPPVGPTADPAVIVTVASATGGCGKTFFATNLAAHLAAEGHRTLLVDLDLQFGEVGAALRIRHPYSVYDGLYDPHGSPLPDRALSDHLPQLVFPHELGFDVLPAPREPALADDVTGDDVRHVLSTVREHYDVVVVDTPPALSDVVLSAVDQSDVIAVLTTLDVPSLHNLTSFLDIMRRVQVDDRRLKLVLNKVEPEIGIEVSQAQDTFGGRFIGELPASRAASRSINSGTVVIRSEPGTPLVRALARSFDAVIPPSLLPRAQRAPSASAAPRGLRAMFRRRS